MKKGYLRSNKYGRYELIDEEGNCLTYFTSGDPIDIYDETLEEWLQGRVEYDDNYGGYYFYNINGRHRSIWDGVLARMVE